MKIFFTFVVLALLSDRASAASQIRCSGLKNYQPIFVDANQSQIYLQLNCYEAGDYFLDCNSELQRVLTVKETGEGLSFSSQEWEVQVFQNNPAQIDQVPAILKRAGVEFAALKCSVLKG